MTFPSMKLRRRGFTLVAGASLALAAFIPAAAETPKEGGTLVIGSSQVPRHLNGAVQSGAATAVPSTQLFASPLRFDGQWNPQPYLAKSWSLSQDGTSLTLNLRDNAFFHDGKPITSADVAYSIMVNKENHPFKTMFGPVEKVETPDAHTAIIRMNQPHPAIILAMSPALCPILPKHIYDDGQAIKNHPRNSQDVVGSGPFQFVSYEPGKRLELKKFDKFFIQGRPHLDRIILNINRDANSLALGLERGDMQMLPFQGSSVVFRRLQKDKNLVVDQSGYDAIGPINWLAFNTAKAPFDDKRVRQAVAHMIDKNFLTKVLMGGIAQPAIGPIINASPFAQPDVKQYTYDVKAATALLDAAGLKPGADGIRAKINIDYIPGIDELQKNPAEYIRAQLKKVGIQVNVRASADFPSWAKRMAEHDFDMSMDVVWNWGDPVIGVHRTYLSNNIRPAVWTNTQSYKNPEVDKLLDEAGKSLEPTKRKAYYSTFQKSIAEDVPIHFLNVVPYYTAYTKKLGNAPSSIWGVMSPMDEVYLR